VAWRPDLQEKVFNAKKPEARQHGCWEHQEAYLKVLPAEDGARSYRPVFALDEGPPYGTMLVVQRPHANEGPPLQGESRVANATEGSLGTGAEGDGEAEGPVEDPGPSRRSEVQSDSTGLPHIHGCGEDSARCGRVGRRRE